MGVHVGPQDPDASESFGAVNGQVTARNLVRHHARMYGPKLLALLTLGENIPRTKALVRGEVDDIVLAELPDDAVLHGVAIRGADDGRQAVSYTFSIPREAGGSGRVTKGAMPYDPEDFPQSHAAGTEASRIQEAKDAGLPWLPTELTQALARVLESQGPQSQTSETAEVEAKALREERDRLEQERDELRSQLAAKEAAEAESERLAEKAQAAAAGDGDPANTGDGTPVEEPWPGYSELNVTEVQAALKEGDYATREYAERVVTWEDHHGGRSTATTAANRLLDTPGAD